jgi:hypothetical protein
MIVLDDSDSILGVFSSVCTFCVHSEMGERVCSAFPNGIPDVIWTGEHDHTTPYPGDNGIRFEPIEKDTD